MSLGDYVRLLRAVKGAPTPWEMEEEGGIPSAEYRQIEQRYREVSTEETLQKLAAYFEVPLEELQWRRRWSRKALSADLARAQKEQRLVHLTLRTGEELTGWVQWWDLGAFLLRRRDDGWELVLQRHAVEKWDLEPE